MRAKLHPNQNCFKATSSFTAEVLITQCLFMLENTRVVSWSLVW
jgi:hypothetical protein